MLTTESKDFDCPVRKDGFESIKKEQKNRCSFVFFRLYTFASQQNSVLSKLQQSFLPSKYEGFVLSFSHWVETKRVLCIA